MKKFLSILLACLMVVPMLAMCVTAQAAGSDEIVDGKFVETKKITVEVYNRNNDGGTTPEDNVYTDFIKEGMLRDHNVEVTFVPVGRWTEIEELNNLLAAGDAPDICVTYDYSTIQTYANMGGVVDMSTYLEEYKDMLPNFWNLLGDENIYWHRDPENGTVWAVEARLFVNKRINTFVREDWLKKLDLAEPTTLEQFEAVLRAFKDNAAVLLGDDADKMIPFSISFDVGWRADHLLTSFVPDALSEKDKYTHDFDDRHLLYPGYKEGVRKLNEWYNEGLIWADFPLYASGDTTEDNLIKSGYVGAFIHNWDYPYRSGETGLHYSMQQMAGEDAAFIAVEPFLNDAGVYRKFLSAPVDRKVFFPSTNDEPVASLLYLDWIATLENRMFLQIGEEGITHETQPDGSVKTLSSPDANIMNSLNNIDYTIVINGLDLGDPEKNVASVALGYAYVEPRFIQKAFELSSHDARYSIAINVGAIVAEEGMGPALKEKRDAFLNQAVTAKPDQFDAVYDAGMQDYLQSGGQAIIDERTAAYAKYYE